MIGLQYVLFSFKPHINILAVAASRFVEISRDMPMPFNVCPKLANGVEVACQLVHIGVVPL